MKSKKSPEPIYSEVDAAQDCSARADFWPEIILAFKAGNRKPLAQMVLQHGLQPNSEAAIFVAGHLANPYKPTVRDKNIYLRHEILASVRSHGPDMKTETEVFEKVADEFSRGGHPIGADGVKKKVQRDRKRNRK